MKRVKEFSCELPESVVGGCVLMGEVVNHVKVSMLHLVQDHRELLTAYAVYFVLNK